MFPFFQSEGTSLECHNLSNMMVDLQDLRFIQTKLIFPENVIKQFL